MDFLQVIEEVSNKMGPGRSPTFDEAHIFKAIENLGAGKPVGRKKLSHILGLGEGETRTLVKHLREKGLIEVSRRGMVLSKFGKEILSDLRSKVSRGVKVPENSLTVGPCDIAVLIKDAADSVRYGMEQRDTAIKVGALGASTLIFRDNTLVMPIPQDFCKKNQEIHDLLVKELEPEEDDVVVIASAEDERTAELAAKAIALKMIKSC
ncbi:MAG: DUF4443 domain-containing protein [Thermoproteota archaeon]